MFRLSKTVQVGAVVTACTWTVLVGSPDGLPQVINTGTSLYLKRLEPSKLSGVLEFVSQTLKDRLKEG